MNRLRVAILDDHADRVRTLAAFERLRGHDVLVLNETLAPDLLAQRIADREAIVLIRERTRVDVDLLERLPALRLISQTGRPGDHIDEVACTARGIAIAGGTGSPDSTAELTLALMLAARRALVTEHLALRAGRWQTTLGTTIRDRVVGIHGYGRIGAKVAALARAFGARPLAWGRDASLARAAADGVATAASAEALYTGSDIVSVHLRLTPQTRGVIGAALLARMRPGSLFINTARAGLVAPGALLAALDHGHPAMAALDVFDQEPVEDDPLVRHPAVLATPHLGYVERDSYEQYFGQAFDHVNAFAAGTPTGIVNPQVLTLPPRG